MKRVFVAIALLAGCSGAEEAAQEAAEAIEGAAEEAQEALAAAGSASLFARIGGTVVPTGSLFVEVLPHRDGVVEALVLNADGEVVEDAGTLQVQVQGADGSSHPVSLEWDAEESKYVGAYDGEIAASGPVAVQVTADDESFTGNLGKLAVAPEAAQRGGTIVVAGDYSAELLGKADGSVTAYVVDADGNEVSGDADLNIQVGLDVDGTATPIALAWDPQVEAYVGRPEGDIQWTGGSMTLSVENEGTQHQTRVISVAPAPVAAHDGEIVVVGDYAVEVVPEDDGNLKAYVVDARGSVIAEPAQANVIVMVDHRPVTLAWDASANCYKGQVDARFDATAAPVQVVVTHRGRRHWGGIRVRHAPRLRPWHQRRVVVRADLPPGPPPHAPAVGVRVRHPRFRVRPAVARVDVRGPGGAVRVRGPGAMVSIMGPSAMINVGPAGGVRVRGPGAQGVIVGPMGGVRVRGPGGGVRVRGPGGMASVMVRAPAPPRPRGMASVRVRGPGGGASVMVNVGGMRRGMRR